jgi:acyl-homoserine-lactone acylase
LSVVEFGKKVKVRSVMTGGASGDSSSPHFKDKASMYCERKFKDVLFYKDDVMKHVERTKIMFSNNFICECLIQF